MKYLCLVYLSSEKWSAAPDSACAAYGQKIKDSGHFVTGAPLVVADPAQLVAAAERLQLHHFGAEVREHDGAERPGHHLRHVEHAHAFKTGACAMLGWCGHRRVSSA